MVIEPPTGGFGVVADLVAVSVATRNVEDFRHLSGLLHIVPVE